MKSSGPGMPPALVANKKPTIIKASPKWSRKMGHFFLSKELIIKK
jgi:hypothetical protein